MQINDKNLTTQLMSKTNTKFLIGAKNDTKKQKIFLYRFEGNTIKFNGALQNQAHS